MRILKNWVFQSVSASRLVLGTCKLFGVACLIAYTAATAESGGVNVFFGGFAYSGKASDVGKNFPNASSLNAPTEDGTPFLGRAAREFFQKNKDRFSRMNLQFGVARREDTPLVLALARIFHQSGAKRICGAKWKRDGEGVLKTLIFSQRGHSPPYPRG
jgi:hypothetical protein